MWHVSRSHESDTWHVWCDNESQSSGWNPPRHLDGVSADGSDKYSVHKSRRWRILWRHSETLAIKNATLCGRYYSLSLSMWRRRLSASRIYNIPPPGETLTTLAGCPQLFGPVSPRVASMPHFLGPERREIVCYCRDCRPWIGWNEFFEFKLLAKLFPLA